MAQYELEVGVVRLRQPWGVFAFVAAVIALSFFGAVLAVGLVTGTGAHDHAEPATAGTGLAQKTSFGQVTVQEAEKLAGLTSKSVGGVTHGVQNLVTQENAQVQVGVLLTNLSDRSVEYSPAQFQLRVGRAGEPSPAQASNVLPGTLAAGASIEGRLGFVVPRATGPLFVEFADPGSSRPIVIPLGSLKALEGSGGPGGLTIDPTPNQNQGGDHDHG